MRLTKRQAQFMLRAARSPLKGILASEISDAQAHMYLGLRDAGLMMSEDDLDGSHLHLTDAGREALNRALSGW